MPEPRSVIAQPDFTQIFASAAALGELLNWPSEDYLRGWGYLQPQEAPPMEYFNAFYNGTDTKLLYLFSAANIRKNSTAYQVDDIVTSPNLNSQFWLVCTQAGTTDANEPDYSEVEANQEITDGTAKFLVTPKVSKGITVGNTEPDNPREGDLWLQTSSSKKTSELKQRTASGWAKVLIETILNAVTDSPIKTLERNAACNVNTVYAETTLPKGGFLICTQAGTTGASAATGFLDAEEGEEVTDGTAKFVVHYFEEIASNKSVVKSINDVLPDEEGNVKLQTGLNLLSRSKAYQYGDIAYSPNLPSWAYLFCVTAGTTAASEPSFTSINTMGQYITDGTAKWIVDDIRFNTPVGVVFYDTYLHDGCVKINGAPVQRSDYKRPFKIATDKNLFYDKDDTYTFTGTTTVSGTTITGISAEDIEKLQTAKEVCGDGILITGDGIPEDCMIDEISTDSVTITVEATAAGSNVKISYGNIHNYPYLYGWGDGETTFVLPDYRARVIQGGDTVMVLASALPNIKGYQHSSRWNIDDTSNADSALYKTTGSAGLYAAAEQSSNNILKFDASRSNPIYGRSDKVQPPALQLISQLRY